MKIEIQNHNDITILRLQGELSAEAGSVVQETASGVITKGAAGIVLDMENVISIDSNGLEMLLWLRDYCDENNRQFKIAALDENCTTIMEITRLASRLDLHKEIAEAIKSFV